MMAETLRASRVREWARSRWRDWVITLAAFVLALIVGAILMIAADPAVSSNFAYLFTAPGLALGAAWTKVSTAYAALLTGAIGSPEALAATTAAATATVAATTTAAVAAAATAAAAVAAARTVFARTRFVDDDGTAFQRLAVHAVDRGLRLGIRAHLHEAEALGATGVAVHHDLGGGHVAVLRERLLQRFVAHRVRQVADIEFVTHERSPQQNSDETMWSFNPA